MNNVPENMHDWFNLQPTKIQKAMTAISYGDQGDLYHISRDGEIKRFVPYVTRRTAQVENISVPRISTGTSLVGCLIGYSAVLSDIMEPDWGKGKDKWKGGWYIYRIPYEYCIKPDESLLFDVERTGERWLVAYDERTRQYIPEVVGQLVPEEVVITPVPGKDNVELVRYVLQTDIEMELWPGKVVEAGHYRIQGPIHSATDIRRVKDSYVIDSISNAEYLLAKKAKASMLSRAMEW